MEHVTAPTPQMANGCRSRRHADLYYVGRQSVRGAGMVIVQEDGQRFAIRHIVAGSGALEDELLHGLRQFAPDGKRCAPERRGEVVVAYWHSHGFAPFLNGANETPARGSRFREPDSNCLTR